MARIGQVDVELEQSYGDPVTDAKQQALKITGSIESIIGDWITEQFKDEIHGVFDWNSLQDEADSVNDPSDYLVSSEDGQDFYWEQYIGSWLSHSPSGKIYTPFANGNVATWETGLDDYWKNALDDMADAHDLSIGMDGEDISVMRDVTSKVIFDEDEVVAAFKADDLWELVNQDEVKLELSEDSNGDWRYALSVQGNAWSDEAGSWVTIKVTRALDGTHEFERGVIVPLNEDDIIQLFLNSAQAKLVDPDLPIEFGSGEKGEYYIAATGKKGSDDENDTLSFSAVEVVRGCNTRLEFELL